MDDRGTTVAETSSDVYVLFAMSDHLSMSQWVRDETRSRHYDTATANGSRGFAWTCKFASRKKTCTIVGRDGDSGAQKVPRERSRLHLRNGGNFLWVALFPIARFLEVCGSTRLPWSFVPSLKRNQGRG